MHRARMHHVADAIFRDRVVHHTLCAVVEPLFDHGFIHHSYANRAGKGAHRAVKQDEHWRDRRGYVLLCDLFRYFQRSATNIHVALAPCDLSRRVVRSVGGAWPSPSRRVVRGGSWNNNPRNLRAGVRDRNNTDNRNNALGFRVASTPPCQGRRDHGPDGCAEGAFRDGHDESGTITFRHRRPSAPSGDGRRAPGVPAQAVAAGSANETPP